MAGAAVEGLKVPQPEKENALTTVVGIGVVIVLHETAVLDDEQLRILTVKESTDKPGTGKKRGIRGIVQETVKIADIQTGVAESPEETLMGAMGEVIREDNVETEGNKFNRVVFSKRHEIPLRSLKGMAGGLEVVIFTGTAINLALTNEVTESQWVTAGNFLDVHSTRPTSRELVQYAVNERLLSRGMDQYRRGLTVPVFQNDIPFGQFLRERNTQPDITDVLR